MPVLTVVIDQNKENAFRQVLEREPGWDKSLVVRADESGEDTRGKTKKTH